MSSKSSLFRAIGLASALLFTACGTDGNTEHIGSPETDISLVNKSLLGTYHLPGRVDEANVTLRADGTFRWRIFGSDFVGEEEGEWRTDGDGVKLRPSPGQSGFRWVTKTGLQENFTSLSAAQSGADLKVTGTNVDEVWQRGRICAKCGSLDTTSLALCTDKTGL